MNQSPLAIARRAFVGQSIATAFAMANPLCAADDRGRPEYIDIHVHLAQQWYGEKHGALTATQLLRWMDANHIAQAAVLPLVSPEAF